MGQVNVGATITVKDNGNKGPAWSLHSDIKGDWTLGDLLHFTKNALIHIAYDALKEEQGKGFDKNPITIVDGKFGKNVNDVNPLGKIQYVSHVGNIAEIIRYAFEAVWSRSPQGRKSEYLSSNVVVYNGRQVAKDPATLETWLKSTSIKDGDKIRIVNTAPYARKLELQGVRYGVTKRKFGKASKKNLQTANSKGQVKKPNGAYALSAKSIKAKYGRNAIIKFDLMLGSSLGLNGPGRVRKTGRDRGRPYVYPTILIYAVDASGPTTGSVLQ